MEREGPYQPNPPTTVVERLIGKFIQKFRENKREIYFLLSLNVLSQHGEGFTDPSLTTRVIMLEYPDLIQHFGFKSKDNDI